MGRRRREEGDSLGLLLDPICNTFGGIIFLAMIISLLSHRELHTAGGNAGSARSRLQALEAGRTRDRLKADLADANARTALARDTLKALWGVDDVAKIRATEPTAPAAQQTGRALDVLTRLAAERTAADGRADAAHAERMAIEQSLTAAEETNRHAATALAATRAHTAADRAAAQGGGDHAVRLRTPLVHETTKRQVPVLLAHGRVYVPFEYDRDGKPTGPSFDCGPKIRDPDAGIAPDDLTKDHGADLSDPAAADRWVDGFIAGFAPQQAYLAFAVWPDSHETFARLRDRVLARGFDYQLLIQDRGEPIHFGHGDNHVQ